MDLKTSERNDHDCLRFGNEHPNLPNNATHMDGSSLSIMFLEINSTEIDSTFTLVINIYVQNPTSGSLIQITDSFSRAVFDLTIGETVINLNAFHTNGTKCVSIAIDNMFNTSTWYLVGMRRDISAGTVSLIINNDIIKSASDTCGMFGLSKTHVTVGSWNSNTPGFRGLVRCLVMFSILNYNIILANHDTCINEDDNVPPGESCVGFLP
ncbi:hypothetical protein LOTGIDRAFT_176775 [Lottia gigantea]|uniref:Laminin G domain-containing protein n=1 Tax=Lottia gigantea TaxID=225164 RepID=V4BS34_LOTGI|nr:hypothetical protein LOTGIDRAFT_176775 [Lottia gigantea]ESO91734.1 hypothetical protein LOTGIDRAFT_176775 [Lottia gigantea]